MRPTSRSDCAFPGREDAGPQIWHLGESGMGYALLIIFFISLSLILLPLSWMVLCQRPRRRVYWAFGIYFACLGWYLLASTDRLYPSYEYRQMVRSLFIFAMIFQISHFFCDIMLCLFVPGIRGNANSAE